MPYADLTIGDRNPLKRWLQHRRFSGALGVLRGIQCGDRLRVLDFGTGDGELLRQLTSIASVEAWAYEPNPSLMAETKEKLAGVDSVMFVERLGSVESGTFDYIFCLEVFEHLPENEAAEAIAEIHRLLRPDGSVVIGVPQELFLPALLKGLFRMCRRYGDFDATPRNVLGATLGRPPSRRPVAEIAPGLPYHFHHLGFDYRRLEQMLRKRFRLARRWFSPFPVLGAALNSEVYFLLRKAQPILADMPQAAPF